MRTLLVPQIPWKALLVVLSLCFVLPPAAQAQTQSKTQTKAKARKSKSKAKPKAEQKAAPQEASSPAPEKAAAPEAEKAQASEKAQEPEKAPAEEKAQAQQKAPAPEKTPAPPKAPASQKASASQKKSPAPQKAAAKEKAKEKEEDPSERPQSVVQAEERAQLKSRMRVGVGLELFMEDSRLAGSQSINASTTDESFDYSSATFLSATLSLSIPAPIFSDRARIGGAVRLFGNYGASGNRTFGFGLLNQALITGEYGLPVADKTEVMFGGRVGMSLLIPDRELSQEIDRLQVQGVGVWSVPRVGWVAGLSLGGRRRMSERIHLRGDLSLQYDKTYLFATDESIEGLEFRKSWNTSALRFGFTVGAEFSI